MKLAGTRTTERGEDEVYLKISEDFRLRRNPVVIKTFAGTVPAGFFKEPKDIYKKAYYSIAMTPDEPGLRVWNICQNLTPKDILSFSLMEKDRGFSDPDDRWSISSSDDVIGGELLYVRPGSAASIFRGYYSRISQGLHFAKLVGDGGY